MSDPFKKVNNPLFSAAITGATFEDFSQNAVILPAKEKSAPETFKLSQGTIFFTLLFGSKTIEYC